jgi:protoporphyrinogen IX oxidase
MGWSVTDWLVGAYPWIKAFHIISIIAWMAGLLYLPRLFVYHALEPKGSATGETLKVMERRLYKAIMNPAMIASVGFGVLLLATPGVVDWSRGWIHIKLALAVLLIGIHHWLGRWRKRFAVDENHRGSRFFRVVNEIPTLIMIGIVILVVVKPF